MTFSIAAREASTGRFGLAITTSSLCVGSRCPFARADVGAVLTQHRTDPRLGPIGLDLLSQGQSADQTLAILTEGRDDSKWRQVAVVDAQGRTAAYHGSEIYSIHGHAAAEGAIALGNILASDRIPQAMLDGYLDSPDRPFETRLMLALQAGLDAGGELKPVRSAAILIVDKDPFPWMDLLIDRANYPVAELADLVNAYAPTADGFRVRVVNPEVVANDAELVALNAAMSNM